MKCIDRIRADTRPISLLHKAWDDWVAWGWTPIYCSLCWFHVFADSEDRSYWIAFGPPSIENCDAPTGHRWVCGAITPWGAHRSARNDLDWWVMMENPSIARAMREAVRRSKPEAQGNG